MEDKNVKQIVYQVFTRLFGNTNAANRPWGTIAENGVGKFNDFTDVALQAIKELGVSHIWYTGVPHHAVINDYTAFGISNDDPAVVKGRAGSPYAVKDYYQVNPDLAVDPANRMAEFEALIARTHANGMKVIIDIVPNHVARKYEGLNNPPGVTDFGDGDDTSLAYAKNNNFYYIPGEDFKTPNWRYGYEPLGGEKLETTDGKLIESPAKWTGNGSRNAQPDFNDWYETVKINYGVRPDGQKDFPELPAGFEHENYKKHFEFWSDKDLPDSWYKFRDIALFWLSKGVDGFRFDMAEMVPVEFWSFMNSSIKMQNPDAFLLAEVYNPALYRDYIFKGKMDYLYDKVELYDTLKAVMQGHGSTDHIAPIILSQDDIELNMLHFLENHDEQRIASPDFAGASAKGKPAMVLRATITTSPVMLYFGQEVGEAAEENAGFGSPTRTSIFDYIGVPAHQRWMNEGKFDGGQSTEEEKELRDFYRRLLAFTSQSKALTGDYKDIHAHNRYNTEWYNDKVYSFARWKDDEKLVIISNFDAHDIFGFELQLPHELVQAWNLENTEYLFEDQLYQRFTSKMTVNDSLGFMRIDIKPLESFILKLK